MSPSAPRMKRGQEFFIAVLSAAGIVAHVSLRWGTSVSVFATNLPLYLVLAVGGVPLVSGLLAKALRRQFGSDLLAGISIVTAALLNEYLAGSLVVLMLSGGEALEAVCRRPRFVGLAGPRPTDAFRGAPTSQQRRGGRRARWRARGRSRRCVSA